MISAEQRARIRRLFFGEHWKVGTIAAELGVHHDTVQNAVETHRFDARSATRPSMLDAYKPFIVETLEQHPRQALRRAVGFRNFLVHGDAAVEPALARDVLVNHPGDVDRFVSSIRRRVRGGAG